ncbi:MAG: TIGR00270 family protein [Euryarchaeota archaeon CG01_land_8_20_14_3_00_38_12]|nr:MAG: TIGR00270 family protein [Euryarchaeota archaeon CG01_land_8_20_14_3_00_38_12]PJB21598.1 MAG: TIGR00270 family protein [Euryarchaeota archaeon CG_4_9_14_3_um_filter_38_12]
MICEMCGKKVSNLKTVLIEGSMLNVCPNCARFGKPVKPEIAATPVEIAQRLELREKRLRTKNVFENIENELVDDYAKKIRDARTKMNLTPEELGKRINEKKTVITKIESKSMRPDENLIKKLETTLNIKLTEKTKTEKVETKRTGGELTIGDLIKREK